MITQRNRDKMKEYIVSRLDDLDMSVGCDDVGSVGFETEYLILEGGRSLVLLVDKAYPEDSFPRVYGEFQKEAEKVFPVFYKDKDNFFRSILSGRNSLISVESLNLNDLGLQDYTIREINRMILFRPSESFVVKNLKRQIQYYQSESDYGEEGIASYRFKPVFHNYSHIPEEKRKKEIVESTKLGVWEEKRIITGGLSLGEQYLCVK